METGRTDEVPMVRVARMGFARVRVMRTGLTRVRTARTGPYTETGRSDGDSWNCR